MKTASAHSTDLASGAIHTNAAHRLAQSQMPKIVLMTLMAAVALFVVSLLLPEQLSQVALDLMSWCLVAALAAGSLFASVKLIESALDL